MTELLSVSGLSAGYGRAVVLTDIALKLDEGEALAVLGRNKVDGSVAQFGADQALRDLIAQWVDYKIDS